MLIWNVFIMFLVYLFLFVNIFAQNIFFKQSKFDSYTLGSLVQALKEKKDKEKLRKLAARDRKIIRQCVKVRPVKSSTHI